MTVTVTATNARVVDTDDHRHRMVYLVDIQIISDISPPINSYIRVVYGPSEEWFRDGALCFGEIDGGAPHWAVKWWTQFDGFLRRMDGREAAACTGCIADAAIAVCRRLAESSEVAL